MSFIEFEVDKESDCMTMCPNGKKRSRQNFETIKNQCIMQSLIKRIVKVVNIKIAVRTLSRKLIIV